MYICISKMRFKSFNVCSGGYFPLGGKTCIVWATMDVLLCTASIWHMATISVDRYCSLRFPLHYRRTRTPFFVIAKIAFVWVVSIGICSPLAVAGFINPLNVYRGGKCAPAVTQFVMYGSIFAFFVPLTLMVASYALTVKTLTQQAIGRRRERKRTARLLRQAAAHGGTVDLTTANSPWITSISLDQRRALNHRDVVDSPRETNSDTFSTQEPTLTPRDSAAEPEQANDDCTRYVAPRDAPVTQKNNVRDNSQRQQTDAYCGNSNERNATALRPVDRETSRRHGENNAEKTLCLQDELRAHRHAAGQTEPRHEVVSPHHRSDPIQQSFLTKIRQKKREATRVLGVIFIVFVVLWTPFFVLNFVSAACPSCVEFAAPNVYTVLVWLGWISSCANPIIYTSFSPLFRSTFKHVLTCQCGNRSSVVQQRQRQWIKRLREHRIRTESQNKRKDDKYICISIRHVK